MYIDELLAGGEFFTGRGIGHGERSRFSLSVPGESGGWVTATTAVRSIIERRILAPRPVTASVVGLNQRVLVVLRPSKAARARDQHRYRMPFTSRLLQL